MHSPRQPSDPSGRSRILVVGEDRDHAAGVVRLLAMHGHHVTGPAGGADALERLAEATPGIVIIDVTSDAMAGFGLCRAIRNDPSRSSTAILLMTPLADSQELLRAVECGADSVLRKPFHEDALLRRIDSLRGSPRGSDPTPVAERQRLLDLLAATFEETVARERDLNRAKQVLGGLYRIAEGLSQATTEQEVADLALERALELPGIRAGWIFLREPDGSFRVAASRNLPVALDTSAAMARLCNCQRRLLDGSLDAVTNILECERLQRTAGDTSALRFHASIALRLGDRSIGVLNLVGPDGGLFNEEELRILYNIGTRLAVALDRARLREGLERLVDERTAKLEAEVAERARTEEQLRQSQALLQIASRVGRLGAWAFDLDSSAVTWSEEVRVILELPSGFNPTIEQAMQIFEGEAAQKLLDALETCASRGIPFDLELPSVTAKGRHIWVRTMGEPERHPDGAIRRVHGAFQDITASKEAAEETHLLARRLTDTLESLTDAFATLDSNWRFTYVNPEAEQLLQSSRAELLGHVMWESFPDLEASDLGAAYKRTMHERVPVQLETFYRPLGIWLDVHIYPSPEGLVVYGRDVTAQHQAQEAVRASEERFRTLTEAMPQLVWMADREGRNTYVNRRWITYTGMTAEASSGHGWVEAVAPEDRDDVLTAWGEAVSRNGIMECEARLRAADGAYRWSLFRGVPIHGANGEIDAWMGTCTDIDDIRRANDRIAEQTTQLEASELRYRLLFDRNPHPTWVYDTGTLRFLAVNEAAILHYGYSREEFLGMTIRDIRPAEEQEALQRALDGHGERSSPQTMGVFRHRKKDGTLLDVEISSSAINFANRAAALVLAMDVTEKLRLEQQFLRAQRMESIGTLAGGIAHDLNNLLMPIMMGVTLIKRTNPPDQTRRALDNIERSAQRGRDLVRQVLSFARGVEGARVPVDIRDVVHDVETILESTLSKNIVVTTGIAEDLWTVEGDPTQINQVLLNLCVNARDAMPAGGRVSILAENVDVDDQYARMHRATRPGRYVRIEITDEGIGIPKDMLDRIFEPFFTTKEVGRGTGLGLSTVSSIVRSHGGFVNVYSEPGRGSRFRAYFPVRADATSAREQQPPAQTELPRGHGETILVVDDEASILAITRETLETFGYRTLVAEDGAEAIGLFAMHRAQIAVVITDMMMPVMDGPALVAALHRIDPSVRIIASSGISENRPARGINAQIRWFLQKPYSADVLLQTLHRVLSDAAPS